MRKSRSARRHALNLPFDVVRCILASLAGDVATMCAAACVSRTWRDAAREPALWETLVISYPPREPALDVTDERLAELVTRAGAGVDGQPHLTALDVTGCTYVTARGVVAALAAANLQGKLVVLRVRNTVYEEGHDEEVDEEELIAHSCRRFCGNSSARLST